MVEQVDVKCNRCNESCYGEVINSYGKYYHQYCFSCVVPGCNQDLAIVGFFSVDGHLYCREDYHKKRGIKCTGCSKFVEGEAISAAECRFHPTCFGCITCGKVFPAGSEICYDGEDFFCLRCNLTPKRVNGIPDGKTEPDKLTPPITQPTTQLVNGNHDDDEAQVIENVPLQSPPSPPQSPHSPTSPPQSPPQSPPNIKPSVKCAGCDNYIKTGQALLALDKQWHLWCFTCFKCGALLTGEYMGRDGIPYCEKDYQTEFGISCAGCRDYITGKVLQAGEKHYHPSCSRCAKCGEMFGEGEDMYLQGNEIWHPHCSEEQLSDEEEMEISKSEANESGKTSPNQPKIDDSKAQSTEEKEAETFTKASASSPLSDTTTEVPLNLNPVPYGKPAGFRSVKPPGFRSVKPPVAVTQANETVPSKAKSSDDDTDDAPPVPPPPTRSTSSQWRHKYATIGRTSSNQKSNDDLSNRPLSCGPDSTSSPNVNEEGSIKEQNLKNNTLSTSTNSLNSNNSSTFPFKKGIGYNQLQHRRSQKDLRPMKLPTNIDPDRLRQFLDDPDHNVYLEDHEFFQLFKMTRERYYSLPRSKKDELKSGILFS